MQKLDYEGDILNTIRVLPYRHSTVKYLECDIQYELNRKRLEYGGEYSNALHSRSNRS